MALLKSGTRIYGNATVDTELSINGNANSTSNTTGALIVTGGIGLTGNIFSSGNITAKNANLGNLVKSNYYTGTLTTAEQPNITSIGTLGNLNVTNDIIAGNITVNTVNAINLSGTLLTSAQPNITSVGTLTTLAVSGNITSGNANLGNSVIANYFIGSSDMDIK